jgi:hypothetical protein
VSFSGADSARARAEVAVLTATAGARLQCHDLNDLLYDAESAIEEARSSNLRAELAFLKAKIAWSSQDSDCAEHFAAAALSQGNDDGTSVLHMFHVKALAFELLGIVASDRERYDLSAERLREALALIDEAPIRDEWVLASIVMNLATTARDFPRDGDASLIADRVERIRWTDAIQSQKFLCLYGLAWLRAFERDNVRAFHTFLEAAEAAPSVPYRIGAFLNHAMLIGGTSPVAIAVTRYCADLAFRVSWNDVRPNEKVALLFLIELLADHDLARACRALQIYYEARSHNDRGLFRENGRNIRVQAYEWRAEAVVARAESLHAQAEILFRNEYEVWRRLGSEPRAAIAAFDLYRLTNDVELAEYARSIAEKMKLPWLVQRDH